MYSPYGTDGRSADQPAPVQPHFFAPDESWSYGGYDASDDHVEAKRRRIARACDSCRRKKIKCDAKLPKCSHCENYKTECIFTHIEKKRAPPKGAKYIEGLENRLGRMEHLLRLSGLLTEDDEEGTDLGTLEQRLAQQVSNRQSPGSAVSDQQSAERRTSSPMSGKVQSPTSKASSPKLQHGDQKIGGPDKDVDELADLMWCSLMTNNQGETRFIGSSSGFSIFSPKGIQWVAQKTGDSSFTNMISHISQSDSQWYEWREEVFSDIFARRIYKQLPSREETESLMAEFFESFNTMFPLFHEPTFMHLIDKQYSTEPYDGSGWWASLNVALAIAYRIRHLKTRRNTEEEVSWQYFKNALAVLSELTMRNTDLLSVQALIGMCLFLQGSPNPQPSFFLIGAAVRLAHSIGLHKHGSGFGLNDAEIEQRKRVFWIAYMIDKDICLRSGRPPAQDDDDWNIDLPSEDPDDGFGTVPLADGTKTNLFHTLCRFAVISAKVYNKLYSVKAARQSDGELLSTIGELDAELEAWKDSIPIDFRPEHELTALPPHLVIHILVLHFAYYNCLTTIHRRSVHHGYWTSRLADFAMQGLNVKPLNPRVFSSATLCVSAARTSIHLIKYLPAGDEPLVWLVIYYPISALVTLFANILQNPQDIRARSDLKLINVVVDFLHYMSLEKSTENMARMYGVSKGLSQIASYVLDKAEREMPVRQKRKQERDREKLQSKQEPVEKPQPKRSSRDAGNQDFMGQDQLPDGVGKNIPELSANTLQMNEPVDLKLDFDSNLEVPSNSGLPWMSMNNNLSAQRGGQAQSSASASRGLPLSSNHRMFLSEDPNLMLGTGSTGGSSPDYGSAMFGNVDINGLNGMTGQGSFQQPMVPQELWNMPMTFEWDWADMLSSGITPALQNDMSPFGDTSSATQDGGSSNIQGGGGDFGVM